MTDHLHRAERIVHRINELAAITEEDGCIVRTFGTPAFVKGRSLVKSWMETAGLNTTIDHIGNVRGKLVCDDPSAKTLVIGSHIDTVVDAGRFDGPLGLVMGIDLAQHLIQSKTKMPFNLEVVAFCDEEGIRFQTTFLGSKVIAGSFDENLLQKKDKDGNTLKEAIESIGGDTAQLKEDAIAPDKWLGYFEIHIEQGPVLHEKNIPVALVTAIAGQCRAEITFTGFAGHAGTVPMDMRQDALCSASEFILATEAYALKYKEDMVATVGKLDVHHEASNVIPGKVTCSLDVRSAHQDMLEAAVRSIKAMGEEICKERNIGMDWKIVLQTKPVHCDAAFNKLLERSIAETNYELVSLVSGAGHDAVPVSEVSPVCMLFVKCFKGISHNPLENAETKDIAAAIAVSDDFLRKLISNES